MSGLIFFLELFGRDLGGGGGRSNFVFTPIKGRWWSRASKFGAFSGFFMKVIIINNNIKTLHLYYTTYLT